MNSAIGIPTVNFHLWRPCNMRCGFCFATFQDVGHDTLPKGHLGRADCLRLVDELANARIRKINFAGGEPTLCPWLPDLITRAKKLGLTTSVVTNGSRTTRAWLETANGNLDWVALSIDSVNPETLRRIGRTARSGPLTASDYARAIDLFRECGVRIKVNTVVTRSNMEEDLTDFIIAARPERWKLLQVLPVRGQNDSEVDQYVVTPDQFERYVQSSRRVEDYGVRVVPEANDLMTGSYVMVDPAGRFFDNTSGAHTYSRPILKVGVEEAIRDISVDAQRFLERGGLYSWQPEPGEESVIQPETETGGAWRRGV